jgi:hypothetical protein
MQQNDERKITRIDDLVKLPGLDLKVHLGPRSTRAQVIREVTRVCTAMKTHEAAGKRLGLLLGHIMALVQDRTLYKPGFETFEEYRLAVADQFQLSRATVSADLRIARALPELEPEQARRIPGANLTLVARAAKNTSKKKVQALLAKAEKTPILEFRQEMEKRGLIKAKEPSDNPGPGTDVTVPLHLHVSKQTAEAYKKFKADRTDDEAFGELLGIGKRTRKQAA